MIDTGIISLFSVDGTEVTEHNRKYSGTKIINASDVELDAGINKRYIRKNKNSYTLSFTYLPNANTKTVDGRVGRDFLKSLAETGGKKLIAIKLSPAEAIESKYCYLSSYSESLIKRDVANSCSYYDVNITFEEA